MNALEERELSENIAIAYREIASLVSELGAERARKAAREASAAMWWLQASVTKEERARELEDGERRDATIERLEQALAAARTRREEMESQLPSRAVGSAYVVQARRRGEKHWETLGENNYYRGDALSLIASLDGRFGDDSEFRASRTRLYT